MSIRGPEGVSPEVIKLMSLQFRIEGTNRVVFLNPNSTVDGKPAEEFTIQVQEEMEGSHEPRETTMGDLFEMLYGDRARALGMTVPQFIDSVFSNPNNVFKKRENGNGSHTTEGND